MFNLDSLAAVSKEQHKDKLRKREQQQVVQQAMDDEKSSTWQGMKKQLTTIMGSLF